MRLLVRKPRENYVNNAIKAHVTFAGSVIFFISSSAPPEARDRPAIAEKGRKGDGVRGWRERRAGGILENYSHNSSGDRYYYRTR